MIQPLEKPRKKTRLEKRRARFEAGRKASGRAGGSVKARNDERSAKKYLRNFHGPLTNDHSAYVRTLPCCACGRVGLTVAAHVGHARGMGGAHGDWSCLAPLCQYDGGNKVPCHELYDEHRKEFCEEFPKCNPVAVAAQLAAEYLEWRGAAA